MPDDGGGEDEGAGSGGNDELSDFHDYVHCVDASSIASSDVVGNDDDHNSGVGGFLVLEADGVDYARKSLVHTFGDKLKLSF